MRIEIGSNFWLGVAVIVVLVAIAVALEWFQGPCPGVTGKDGKSVTANPLVLDLLPQEPRSVLQRHLLRAPLGAAVRLELLSAQPVDFYPTTKVPRDWEIRVREHPSRPVNFLRNLLGLPLLQPRERTFVGDCTVWHEKPSFRRPGTEVEGVLSDFWAKADYEYRKARLAEYMTSI